MTRAINKGNIKLRKLQEFKGTSSLGVVIPKQFAKRMGLIPGLFLKLELNNNGDSFTVEKVYLD